MARYFAQLSDGIVQRVIVAEQDFINTHSVGDPSLWVETFIDGSQKKNYAGVGDKYDQGRDAFISPKPHDSWVLNEEKAVYESPIPHPKDGKEYNWDEAALEWKPTKAKAVEEEIKP